MNDLYHQLGDFLSVKYGEGSKLKDNHLEIKVREESFEEAIETTWVVIEYLDFVRKNRK